MDKKNTQGNKPVVSIIMGSESDWTVMKAASDFLIAQQVEHECRIVSAHRTPELMMEFSKEANNRGIRVVIAGAGAAAHLPGMVASITPLPVIGVPVKSSNSLDGWDSILSILQMPNGVPVAMVALNAAKNAAILALQILGTSDSELQNKVVNYKNTLKGEVINKIL
jgi:5-(carboxyamino)imidazole ribonucleotide mutase